MIVLKVRRKTSANKMWFIHHSDVKEVFLLIIEASTLVEIETHNIVSKS